MKRVLLAAGVATRADDTGSGTATAPDGVQPPSRTATAPVSVRDAHTLDAVYRAMFILQTAASQLTMDVRRAGQILDPAPSLVTRPDLADHGTGFWADTIGSMACRGNAFWKRYAGSDSNTVGLRVLNPLEVVVWRNKYDEVRYSWRGKDYTPGQADGIAHLKLLRLPGELYGLGPIQAAARGLAGMLRVSAYGDEWFDTSDIPGGILTTEQALTPTQAGEWKTQWKSTVRAGETAVLGAGLDYKALMLTPAEAQWLESQKFSTTSIARWFGIPARQMLAAVDGNSLTYMNAGAEDIAFNRYTLMRYLREAEAVMTDILPRGQDARFNVDALLRADTKTRYEAHKVGIDAGFLSKEEARAIEGLPGPAPEPAPAKTPAQIGN